MPLIGFILLCVSAVKIMLLLGGESITLSSFITGCGAQIGITIASMLLFAFLIVPFIGALGVISLALVGCYYYPETSVVFICTALGVCFIMFSVPNQETK